MAFTACNCVVYWLFGKVLLLFIVISNLFYSILFSFFIQTVNLCLCHIFTKIMEGPHIAPQGMYVTSLTVSRRIKVKKSKTLELDVHLQTKTKTLHF